MANGFSKISFLEKQNRCKRFSRQLEEHRQFLRFEKCKKTVLISSRYSHIH